MKSHASHKTFISFLVTVSVVLLVFCDVSPAASGARSVRRQEYMRLRQEQQRRMRENNERRQLLDSLDIQKDIVYGNDHPASQKLDLYVPKDATGPLPLVVWIHGGAWREGDKANPRALWLAAHGYAVASINYRLTDVAIFPAQIYDCKAAIRYLRANAQANHIDPDRIGVWGASAGGHLVALLGVSNGKKELEGEVGDFLKTSSDVQAVCDWFGPSDFFTMPINKRTFSKGDDPELQLLGGRISENQELARLCSPTTHVEKDAVPFLIMHGDKDKLVPVQQSELLQETLQAAGTDSTLIILKGKAHGFGNEAKVMDPILEFFERTLKNAPQSPPDKQKTEIRKEEK